MLAPDGWTPEAQLPTELLAALWRAAFEEADHNENSSMIPDEYSDNVRTVLGLVYTTTCGIMVGANLSYVAPLCNAHGG